MSWAHDETGQSHRLDNWRRGLGKAMALELAQAGAIVALVGRNQAKLREAAQEISAFGFCAHVFVTDVPEKLRSPS